MKLPPKNGTPLMFCDANHYYGKILRSLVNKSKPDINPEIDAISARNTRQIPKSKMRKRTQILRRKVKHRFCRQSRSFYEPW